MEEHKEVYVGAYVPRHLKEWLRRRAAAEHRTLSEELKLILETTHQTGLESAGSLTAEQSTTPPRATENCDAWAILESMEGSFEAPSDLASELDHYLYGTPKRLQSSE